jgi:hypothetical protein
MVISTFAVARAGSSNWCGTPVDRDHFAVGLSGLFYQAGPLFEPSRWPSLLAATDLSAAHGHGRISWVPPRSMRRRPSALSAGAGAPHARRGPFSGVKTRFPWKLQIARRRAGCSHGNFKLRAGGRVVPMETSNCAAEGALFLWELQIAQPRSPLVPMASEGRWPVRDVGGKRGGSQDRRSEGLFCSAGCRARDHNRQRASTGAALDGCPGATSGPSHSP